LKSNKRLYKAKLKLQEEMNVFYLVNSMQKIKAAVSAIISNDASLMNKTKEIYFRNALVVSDTDKEKQIIAARTPFRKFLF
jgi:hypothetical protein